MSKGSGKSGSARTAMTAGVRKLLELLSSNQGAVDLLRDGKVRVGTSSITVSARSEREQLEAETGGG